MNIARYLEAQGYTPYRWVYGDQNKYLASKPIEEIYNELKNLLY